MTRRFDLFVPRLYGSHRQETAGTAEPERPVPAGRSKAGARRFRHPPAEPRKQPAEEPAGTGRKE